MYLSMLKSYLNTMNSFTHLTNYSKCNRTLKVFWFLVFRLQGLKFCNLFSFSSDMQKSASALVEANGPCCQIDVFYGLEQYRCDIPLCIGVSK